MTWFNVRNMNSIDKTAEIMINGKIGKSLWDEDALAANDLIRTVNALGDIEEITVLLNSPGGSVNDGIAIFNYLKRHKATINIEVLAEASSIASVILQAGDVRSVPKNALIMVHDPMAGIMGMFNSKELRSYADKLDVVRDSILPSYVDNNSANKSAEEIQALLSAETYMTGEQAVALGFADNLLEENKAVACSSKEEFQTLMLEMTEAGVANIKSLIPAEVPAPVNLHEIAMNACAKAGFSALATNMVKRCQDESAILAEIATATEIQNICVASNMKEDTEALLAHLGNPVAMVKEAIALCQANSETEVVAILDEASLDDSLKPAVINHREIYAARVTPRNA
jgi:ATP-dependent Clp protease protease subunit